MYCPKCGKENQDSASFCIHCGNPLNADTTMSFEKLRNSSTPSGPLQVLQSEATRAKTFSILALIFCILGLVPGPIFAIINLSRINNINRLNFFPSDMNDLDAYDEAKSSLYKSRKRTILALILLAVSVLLQFVIMTVLAYNGIDIYEILLGSSNVTFE